MKATPKTIQIFLPGGDPRGIRIAEITTRILQVIEIPRSLLPEFLKMPESQQVALYFLIGVSDETDDPQVYVGQTGDLRARLISHNKNKEFWERALIITSKTNSMTQTHALFLEWHCIQAIRQAGRYADHNGTSGTRPHTPAPLEADCLEMFETASTLLATLGHPLFVPLTSGGTTTEDDELFYCTGSEADGRGLYTQERARDRPPYQRRGPRGAREGPARGPRGAREGQGHAGHARRHAREAREGQAAVSGGGARGTGGRIAPISAR